MNYLKYSTIKIPYWFNFRLMFFCRKQSNYANKVQKEREKKHKILIVHSMKEATCYLYYIPVFLKIKDFETIEKQTPLQKSIRRNKIRYENICKSVK